MVFASTALLRACALIAPLVLAESAAEPQLRSSPAALAGSDSAALPDSYNLVAADGHTPDAEEESQAAAAQAAAPPFGGIIAERFVRPDASRASRSAALTPDHSYETVRTKIDEATQLLTELHGKKA